MPEVKHKEGCSGRSPIKERAWHRDSATVYRELFCTDCRATATNGWDYRRDLPNTVELVD